MAEILPVFALAVAAFLTIGETLVLIRTDKYWPLSVDDYVVCAVLAYTAFTFDEPLSRGLMLVAWAFMAGNLYAMLFTRMDPKTGTRERLGILTVLMLAAMAGAAMTLAIILS